MTVTLRTESNTSERAICIPGSAAVLEIPQSAVTLSEVCGSKICLSRHIFTLVTQLMKEAIKAKLWLLAIEKELPEKMGLERRHENRETKFGDGTFPPLWMDDGQIM